MNMLTVTTIFILFFSITSNAEDYYTTCFNSTQNSDHSQDMSVENVRKNIFSVFLGKDARLASYILENFLSDTCTSISIGFGSAETLGKENPYSNIYNEYIQKPIELKSKAKSILLQVQSSKKAIKILETQIP